MVAEAAPGLDDAGTAREDELQAGPPAHLASPPPAAPRRPRAARSGRKAASIRTPRRPPSATTSKLADAPGCSAAIPTGVMLGSAATAGRTRTSADFGRRPASSTPIS